MITLAFRARAITFSAILTITFVAFTIRAFTIIHTIKFFDLVGRPKNFQKDTFY
jgi:hypothetical protein